MAKVSNKVQGKAIATRDGQQGTSFEHEAIFDDSLLPDATELAKLQELDPTIIDWIKNRTEREQDMRHEYTRRRLSIVEKGQTRAYTVDLVTIIVSFILMVLGMGLSGWFIHEDQVVIGTIFGGGTLVLAVRSFLNFRRNPKSKLESKKEK